MDDDSVVMLSQLADYMRIGNFGEMGNFASQSCSHGYSSFTRSVSACASLGYARSMGDCYCGYVVNAPKIVGQWGIAKTRRTASTSLLAFWTMGGASPFRRH